jgi:hypothetical protein
MRTLGIFPIRPRVINFGLESDCGSANVDGEFGSGMHQADKGRFGYVVVGEYSRINSGLLDQVAHASYSCFTGKLNQAIS